MALASGLALTGCGGDTPEAMQSALHDAAPTLAFVEADEGRCVADATFELVGFETLALEGYTSESIALDPGGSIERIIESHESPELRSRLVDCLDVDGRFRSALGSQHLPDGVVCETTFGTDVELVDDFVDSLMDGEDAAIELDDTPDVRDLIRPCATEADFAAVFDLTPSDELAEAIDGTFTTQLRRDGAPCAGAPIVAALGFEALNDLGVDADVVRLSVDDLGLDDDAIDELTAEIAQCSDFVDRARVRYRSEEPYFGPCVVEAVAEDDAWVENHVAHALDLLSTTRTAERLEAQAVNGCVEARIEEVFGEFDRSIDFRASTFASGLHRGSLDHGMDEYGATLAEYRCLTYGLFDEYGEERILELANQLGTLDPDTDDAYWEANDLLWGRMGELHRDCVGDWLSIATDLERAGFSDVTLSCVRDSIDVEGFADVFARRTHDMTWEEFDRYLVEFDAATATMDRALDDCYVDEDRAVYKAYNDWRESFEQYEGEEEQLSA